MHQRRKKLAARGRQINNAAGGTITQTLSAAGVELICLLRPTAEPLKDAAHNLLAIAILN